MLPSTTMSFSAFLSHSYLPKVLEVIESRLVSDAPALADVSRYLYSLGGKHVRPLLTLWTGSAFGVEDASEEAKRHLVTVSAGIELIHLATLLHDDIIDNAELRRGKKSAFKSFGLNKTLLSGDFLLVRAFGLCSTLPHPIIQATENACVHLTEGEVLEESLAVRTFTKEESINIARTKTAALFKLGTYSAAYLGNADTDEAAKMGEAIGIAFQIIDDVLDVTGTEKELGKKPGQDILEKKPSLVNVLWLGEGSVLSKRLTTEETFNNTDLENALIEIRHSKALSLAKETADHYIEIAKESLKKLSTNQESSAAFAKISALIDFAVERTR